MHKSLKLITALSVAGLAVAAGSAFTGAGVTKTGTAALDQFVGGTVSQTVKGATLNKIEYGFVDDGTNTAVNKVTLTFADATGNRIPTLLLTGGAPATFTCTAIATADFTSECNAAASTSQTGVTSAAITIPEDS
ncbi:conserved exported hypothetical protein [Arthrobacter sp. 9AX]|uniref:hypothetical protein n=1 Tax=Arthrobacter sp. 9AX TaxID=2653131 RepID=UPI0012F2740E|nr:hypothetical protein [Arthrobacter sp. 9AX]VXC48136.1 conserved exported hypothetical protein [Arthrobacter sp. 9AX]